MTDKTIADTLSEFELFVCDEGKGACGHFDCTGERKMAAEIVRLRATVATLTTQRAAARADAVTLAESIEDFVGAQGTAYEPDQYLMLAGVLRDYNARTTTNQDHP